MPVCVTCVYGPQMGRMEAGKKAFRDRRGGEVGRSDRRSGDRGLLCVAGDFNSHIGVVEPGDEESIGTFGWGTRNSEGRELVDEERVGGRGHVLPEEGGPHNSLQERTAQDRSSSPY